ncbi:MAG: lysophospholipid acyltransferase family protein [Bacteroidales bacterium]|nr:lysophospholipid acyltransferase family protein [Bacteroidales bacterium]
MNVVLTALAYFFILLIGILPFWLLYTFSDFARFLLKDVFGYRKNVIVSNLKRCFPNAGEDEIKKLTKDAYKNLMDVLVEGFKAFTMSRSEIVKRHKILNPEFLNPYKNSSKNIIATPCHYGNWEWGALSPALQLDYKIAAFYTPLSNPYMDRRIRKNRSRTGTMLASTRQTSQIFEALDNSRAIFIMAADQSPSKSTNAIWVDFLGQPTAFLHGVEKYARQKDLPVVFVDIQRVKRGYYTLELSLITKNPTETKPGEITAAYAKRLEDVILKNPGNWLWSHRRWKLKKD